MDDIRHPLCTREKLEYSSGEEGKTHIVVGIVASAGRFDIKPGPRIVIGMLDKEVLPGVLKTGGKIYGYVTKEKVKDLGTHERYVPQRYTVISRLNSD